MREKFIKAADFESMMHMLVLGCNRKRP
ncbi:MAG: hypothetical protein QOK07_2227, partial [Gemmatimonadaceae bacterium]|nr:hypothetical protein [Gemmatimonadaceae bacterium]